MVESAELKEVRWRGDSRKLAHEFPKGARNKLGKELTRVQMGLLPRDGKALTSVGPGVQEMSCLSQGRLPDRVRHWDLVNSLKREQDR